MDKVKRTQAEVFTSSEGVDVVGYSVMLYDKEIEDNGCGIYDIYNNGFSVDKYSSPDGMALFGVHIWCSTGNTWVNYSDRELTAESLAEAIAYGEDFKDASGVRFPQKFDTIITKKGMGNVKLPKGMKLVKSDKLDSDTMWILVNSTVESAVYKDNRKMGIVQLPYMMYGSTGLKELNE